LITLIYAKKKSEQKFHQDPTNPAKVKQAIKRAQEKGIKKTIRKLENINVDPYTAWQSSKLLQTDLSHHHIDNTHKYIKLRDKDGNLTAKPADQVQIQGEFFSK
jgi:hypothetical protein